MKKALALLLALLMTLTACSAGGTPRDVHRVDWVTSPGYLPEDIPLITPAGDLSGCCTDGEYIYLLADEKTEAGVRSVLSRICLADGTAETLEQYEPPQPPEESYATRLGPFVGADGTLWVYEAWIILYYDLPEDFDPNKEARSKYCTGRDDFHHLRQLDPATGKQKKLIDLSELAAALDITASIDVLGLAVDGGGNIYIAANGGVSVADSNGKLLFTLETDIPYGFDSSSSGGALAVLPDGTVAALIPKPGGLREVRTIDPAVKGWGEARYALPGAADLIYSGTGGFLFFFTQGRELYAWEPESGEPRRLLSWTAMDLEGTVRCFVPMDGGKLAALTFQSAPWTDYESFYKSLIRLYMLSPSDKDPNAGKIKLVFGTMFSLHDSDLRAQIERFNKENDRYLVEIRDYAGENADYYNMDDGEYRLARDAAMQRLRADVAAGNAPDLWDTVLDLGLYGRKGYLEDLWPWIDGDEELGGREALMSHALECASIDGKLYEISDTFCINTVIARSDVVGDRIGWTLEEMLACWQQLPEGSSILPPDCDGYELLFYLFRFDADKWVDWSSGTCRFDTQEFRGLLELCRQAQLDYDPGQDSDPLSARLVDPYTALRDRQYLIEPVTLFRPSDLLYHEALCSSPEHITDYGAYLNENHIYSSSIDENGNWRDQDAVICYSLQLAEQARETGMYANYCPLAADAVIGALEGGGYAAYVGWPSQDGAGSTISLARTIGMSASCRDKEGAWAFIRRYLLPGGRNPEAEYGISGFSINKEDFEEPLQPQWFKDNRGNDLLDADGSRIEEPERSFTPVPTSDPGSGISAAMLLYRLVPSEIQWGKFLELYEASGPSREMDSDLWNIIEEQAGAYFAGDKSLDETVELIQRRAALYVNENR